MDALSPLSNATTPEITMPENKAAITACNMKELARALRVSIGTVRKWNGEGCPRFLIGKGTGKGSRPRYELDKVKAWLEQRAAAADGKGMEA